MIGSFATSISILVFLLILLFFSNFHRVFLHDCKVRGRIGYWCLRCFINVARCSRTYVTQGPRLLDNSHMIFGLFQTILIGWDFVLFHDVYGFYIRQIIFNNSICGWNLTNFLWSLILWPCCVTFEYRSVAECNVISSQTVLAFLDL